MKRSELIDEITQKTPLNNLQASDYLSVVLNIISEALSRNEKVVLPGFGTFHVKEHGEYMGYNPATGEGRMVQTGNTVLFTPSKILKKKV